MNPLLYRTLAVVLFLAGTLVFLSWIPDDSYISFRYAANFADGHGLVFNPGERVEGYSNFLWTVLLGLLGMVGANIVTSAVVLSLVCAVGMVWFSLSLFEAVARAVSPNGTAPGAPLAIVGLALVASLPMVYWASSGLETSAAAMFLVLGTLLHIRGEASDDSRSHVGSVLAFMMVAVLRPEGPAFFALNAIVLYVRHRGRMRRSTSVTLVVSIVLLLAVLAARTAYYGSLVPNTYWAKPSTTIGHAMPLLRGLRYLSRYAVVSGLVLTAPFVVAALRAPRGRHAVRYIAAIAAVQVAFIIWVGGDVLRFDRFAVAFHPMLLALALAGTPSGRWRRPARAALATAVAVVLALNAARVYRAHSKLCVHDWMHAQVHAALGRTLAESLPAGSSIVFNEIGATPYYSGLVTYDMIGLTDQTVASIIFRSYREHGTSDTEECRRDISDYLMSRRPTCVIVPSRNPIDVAGFTSGPQAFHPIWYGLYRHPRLQEGYRPAFTVRINPSKYLNVFYRRGVDARFEPVADMPAHECTSVTMY